MAGASEHLPVLQVAPLAASTCPTLPPPPSSSLLLPPPPSLPLRLRRLTMWPRRFSLPAELHPLESEQTEVPAPAEGDLLPVDTLTSSMSMGGSRLHVHFHSEIAWVEVDPPHPPPRLDSCDQGQPAWRCSSTGCSASSENVGPRPLLLLPPPPFFI
eukprot:745901-Hanusia_phi.AAC.2